MKASVIIITKNQKKLLQKSLPVLLNQDLKDDYEIIVVDSGSTDGAREYVQRLPIKLIKIKPKVFNFAAAFNTGAKVASGEFLIRLSGDVIPRKIDFISQMIKPFQDPKVGATYGKYTITGRKGYTYPYFWSEWRFPSKETRYSVKPNLLKMRTGSEHMTEVTNLAGGCCSIRRSIWKSRPFNEKMPAAEDAEYSIYLHLKGFDIVYNPEADVTHEHKIENLKGSMWSEIKWRLIFNREIIKLFLLPGTRYTSRA